MRQTESALQGTYEEIVDVTGKRRRVEQQRLERDLVLDDQPLSVLMQLAVVHAEPAEYRQSLTHQRHAPRAVDEAVRESRRLRPPAPPGESR